ncbi:hypothetical protein ACFFRE_09545, partial [Aciditerrimonas ferrireducens]
MRRPGSTPGSGAPGRPADADPATLVRARPLFGHRAGPVAVAEVVAPGRAVASVGVLWAVAALAALVGALASALARS